VPSLGGEGRSTMGEISPKLHLAPRSIRQIVGKHGTPPRTPQSYSRQDFRPPTPNGQRWQRSKEESKYYSFTAVEEEKKTADVDKAVIPSPNISNPAAARAVPSWGESMKTEYRSSPDQDEIERYCSDARFKKEDQIESRASPGKYLSIQEDKGYQSDEAQAVDDIAMSPIPYDREDPVTLLDLPEDILTLPISPCGGPHDGDNPAQS